MREAEQIRRSLELLPLIGRGASWADAGDARVAGHKALDSLLQRLERLDSLLQRLERLEKATENFLQTTDVEAFYHATTQLVVLGSVLGELRAAARDAITQEEEGK